MINLNTYLTEKLKINKDTISKDNKNYSIKIGDVIFRISIPLDDPFPHFPLPSKCTEIDDDTISFKMIKNSVNSKYFINSKDCMQTNKQNRILLYFTYDDGMVFLEKLKENPEETFNEYLEYENIKDFDFSLMIKYMKEILSGDSFIDEIKKMYNDFIKLYGKN